MTSNQPSRRRSGSTPPGRRGRRDRRDRPTPRTTSAGSARPAAGSSRSRRAGSSNAFPLIATIAAVVGGVILIAAVALSQGHGAAPSGANPGASLVAPSNFIPQDLGDSPNTLGRANAAVTMEITEDYQCPVCGRFARDYLPRLVSEFVQPGLLRIVTHDVRFLDTPNSTESLDAASAAICAGRQGRYWEYHDWLYANQQGENEGAFTRARLDAIADAVELDRASFDACLASDATAQLVTNTTNAAVAAGITATPAFQFNGGQPMEGLPTYDALASTIRSLLPSNAPSASAAASG